MLHNENMNVENHPTYIQVRRLKKDNIQITKKNDIATADYSSVFATNDAYDIFFLDMYTSLFYDACPLKQITVKRVHHELPLV